MKILFEIPSGPVEVNVQEEKPCPHPNECVRPAGCTGDCMSKPPEKESQSTSEAYGGLRPKQCAEVGRLAVGITNDLEALQLLEVCARP